MFVKYSLRTTNAGAARRFYANALGLELPDGVADGTALEAWPLHERAIANGAPAHWLGHLAVDDVEAAAERLGGERLGPTIQRADGTAYATMRDPFGSVVSLRQGPGEYSGEVAWHQLHTRDADASWQRYSDILGWVGTETLDVADPEGGHRLFAFAPGGVAVGSFGNTARWDGVHPHWCFYFPVDDIDTALARVRDHGGIVVGEYTMPDGTRAAPCDDPQGAAFGLIQKPT